MLLIPVKETGLAKDLAKAASPASNGYVHKMKKIQTSHHKRRLKRMILTNTSAQIRK